MFPKETHTELANKNIKNMPNITSHRGNAQENHNEIPRHTHYHGYNREDR